jgi:hypothetical protein
VDAVGAAHFDGLFLLRSAGGTCDQADAGSNPVGHGLAASGEQSRTRRQGSSRQAGVRVVLRGTSPGKAFQRVALLLLESQCEAPVGGKNFG